MKRCVENLVTIMSANATFYYDIEADRNGLELISSYIHPQLEKKDRALLNVLV